MSQKLLITVVFVALVIAGVFLVSALTLWSTDSSQTSLQETSLKLLPSESLIESDKTNNKNEEDVDDTDEDEKVTIQELAAISEKITEEQAVAIAKKSVDMSVVGSITDVELEKEKGIAVYAIEFTDDNGVETDVKVEAKTGKVVLIESDLTDTEDEDKEDYSK
ncbi:MAG: PepSY domain-containing protein [Nanoarchaeota archaeon]